MNFIEKINAFMRKKEKLNKIVVQKINSNQWIQDENLAYELGVYGTTNPYQLFEIIFLNVAASIGRPWRTIYNAKDRQLDLFTNLCVSGILIDKYLECHFKLNQDQRINLLGARVASLVQKYKNSIDED